MFIYAVTRHIRRSLKGGPLLAVAAAIGLYTSGMIPYMTSWGGYLDGASYLLMLPVFIWPESLLVYVIAFILQCLNPLPWRARARGLCVRLAFDESAGTAGRRRRCEVLG